jgi:hypothetical protein
MAGLETSPEHVPLLVIATLQQGVAMDLRTGILLDGLLTSLTRAQHASTLTGDVAGSTLDGGQHLTNPVCWQLPLARCVAGPWHWAATGAVPTDDALNPVELSPDIHDITGRFQQRLLEPAALKIPAHVSPSSGRFRTFRLPVLTIPCRHLVWSCVGNPTAIHDLLDGVPSVGHRRRTGEGAVLNWQVLPHPDSTLTAFEAAHLTHTKQWGRPAPTVCADRCSVRPTEGTAGIRPPYWHPSHQLPLAVPDLLTIGGH